jgi:hypothetical protein
LNARRLLRGAFKKLLMTPNGQNCISQMGCEPIR